MERRANVSAVQVPPQWLDDVLDVLRDLGTYDDLIAEAASFATVHPPNISSGRPCPECGGPLDQDAECLEHGYQPAADIGSPEQPK
jgi:hypothetical protein